MPRAITWQLGIDWDFDTVYTDESAYLVQASGSVRLAPPESGISSPRGTVDRMALTLKNTDRRYSPLNEAGPLYSAIANGGAYHAPMYLNVSINGGSNFYRIFTGVIKIPREGPPYSGVAGTVEIDCRSKDELLLNKRMSTTLATFVALHEAGATESEIIAQFLDDAGLSATDYTLDPGQFVIPWAWLDDESPIEDIWTLAAACGGRFYCDVDGEFRYENMAHWLGSPHDTSQQTYDKGGYGSLDGPTYDDRELYNAVAVIASPRDVIEAGVLWTADEAVTIPADSTRTITAKLRQPAYSIDAPTYTSVTSGGVSVDSDISIVATKYAQRVELEITNANVADAANLVSLSISGVPVSGSPSVEERRESDDAFWTDFTDYRPGRVRMVQGNAYVQSASQAGVLAEFLRDRYQLPRLSGKLRNVPGNAQRRLGDRITIDNADVMTTEREGFIVAIDFRLGRHGFVQDIEWIDADQLYPFDEYFILDTHELGDNTNPDGAPIFY